MLERIRIEKADNGYVVECSYKVKIKKEKAKKTSEMSDKAIESRLAFSDYKYDESKEVAESLADVKKIINEKVNKMEDED